MQQKPIEAVLKEHADSLMALPGVVGIARGELGGKPCILVLVAHKEERLLRQIPPSLDGFPVKVEETGKFRALDPG